MLVDELIDIIEEIAPLTNALDWDKCGVQIASPNREIKKVAIALDPTLSVVSSALELGVDFLLTHHPLALKPKFPSQVDDYYHILQSLLESRVWLYVAHTSLDANFQGPASWLAKEFNLEDITALEPIGLQSSWRIRFYPGLSLKRGKNFTELKGVLASKQDEDTIYSLDILDNFKDMILKELELGIAGNCFYTLLPLSLEVRSGLGLIGKTRVPLFKNEFLNKLKELGIKNFRLIGKLPETISKIAYCPGSGADLACTAFKKGADVYLTGDIKYHQAQEIERLGVALDVGHFILEEKMMFYFYNYLKDRVKNVEFYFIDGKDPFRFI